MSDWKLTPREAYALGYNDASNGMDSRELQLEAPVQAKAIRVELQCWRCLEPIVGGRYNLDDEGPSHKNGCP